MSRTPHNLRLTGISFGANDKSMPNRHLRILRTVAGNVLLVSFALTTASCLPPPPNRSISGHVYNDASNSPLANTTVTIIDINNRRLKSGVTDEHGRYVIIDVPAGEYLVTAGADGYRIEMYDGADGLYRLPADKVRRVTVSEDKATTKIDFRMKELASISGHVYRADNHQPIEGAKIAAWGGGRKSGLY